MKLSAYYEKDENIFAAVEGEIIVSGIRILSFSTSRTVELVRSKNLYSLSVKYSVKGRTLHLLSEPDLYNKYGIAI